MSQYVIYDPPMCCASGVCGPNQDKTLIDVDQTIRDLKAKGVSIERFIITQNPDKFKENPKVFKLIQEQQLKVLPITTKDGEILLSGRYPSAAELTE